MENRYFFTTCQIWTLLKTSSCYKVDLYWVIFSVVEAFLHIQIWAYLINVIKAHSGVGIKTVTCYTLFK